MTPVEILAAVAVAIAGFLLHKAMTVVESMSKEVVAKNDKERRDYLNSICTLIEKAVSVDPKGTEYNHIIERQHRVSVDARVDQMQVVAANNPEAEVTDDDAVLN